MLEGVDYADGIVFDVVPGSVTVDPCYEACLGAPDDVCLLKFLGASSSTPVIPLMTKETDNLTIGTPVTYVGYGLVAAPPYGSNSQRRSVVKPITSLDAYTAQYDDGDATGPCRGDSGGPGLVVVEGVEQVALVTSVGDPSCASIGSSVRVSSVESDFVAPSLQGSVPAPTCPETTDCQLCAQVSQSSSCGGGCGSPMDACSHDASCAALVACTSTCQDAACTAACTSRNLAGLQKYEAVIACTCAGACATVCGSDSMCLAPKCGATPPGAVGSCGPCLDDACCVEAWTCFADPSCAPCFFGEAPPASCDGNAKASTYYQCATSNCDASGCALPTPSGDAPAADAGLGDADITVEPQDAAGAEKPTSVRFGRATHRLLLQSRGSTLPQLGLAMDPDRSTGLAVVGQSKAPTPSRVPRLALGSELFRVPNAFLATAALPELPRPIHRHRSPVRPPRQRAARPSTRHSTLRLPP